MVTLQTSSPASPLSRQEKASSIVLLRPFAQETLTRAALKGLDAETHTLLARRRSGAGLTPWPSGGRSRSSKTIRATLYAHVDATSVVVAILRDITRRKHLDQDLQLALEKASAANVAKSTFLASVSHELRTPLNAIIGFSDLMLTQRLGPLGNPRYAEYIDDIHRSGLQLLALIDDLLDLSRIDAGKMALSEREISLPLLIADARLTGIASQAIRRRNPDRSFREPSQRLRR
jgi:signal transduction histidine kinase